VHQNQQFRLNRQNYISTALLQKECCWGERVFITPRPSRPGVLQVLIVVQIEALHS